MNSPAFIEPTASSTQIAGIDYKHINTIPINGALGAEISGVDFSQNQAPDLIAEVRHALVRHQVIVFRNQSLSSQQFVDLAGQFGTLECNPFVKGVDGHPEISQIKSAENHEKRFTGLWHSDISWAEKPSMGSLLYAVEIPDFGGDTLFANMSQAYSTLSSGMQSLLESLRAEHRVDRFHTSKATYADVPQDGVFHPVITTHPETQQKVLFVNEYFTTRFENMSEEESQPLLRYLFNHSTRPDFTCRIQWQPGTLVFWDNRSTLHYATNDYPGKKRVMHRITVAGETPA